MPPPLLSQEGATGNHYWCVVVIISLTFLPLQGCHLYGAWLWKTVTVEFVMNPGNRCSLLWLLKEDVVFESKNK